MRCMYLDCVWDCFAEQFDLEVALCGVELWGGVSRSFDYVYAICMRSRREEVQSYRDRHYCVVQLKSDRRRQNEAYRRRSDF